jgi:WD40 repeat protein
MQEVFNYLLQYFPNDLVNVIIQYYELKGILEHTIEEHKNSVTCLALLSKENDYVISGSADSTLKIWDMQTYKCIRTLEGHTSSITCIAVFSEKLIVSGSFDRTIKIWNTRYNKKELLDTITEYNYIPSSITFISEKLILCRSLYTFKIWNIETKTCIYSNDDSLIYASKCNIIVLPEKQYKSNNRTNNSKMRIVTNALDYKSIKFLDFENENDEKITLIGQTTIATDSYVSSLNYILKPSLHLLSGSKEGTIKVWNMENLNVELTIFGHNNWISCIDVLPDGRIISGSTDCGLKVWDIDNHYSTLHSCDITLNGHENTITSVVVLSDGRIVSCSLDTTIKVWI